MGCALAGPTTLKYQQLGAIREVDNLNNVALGFILDETCGLESYTLYVAVGARNAVVPALKHGDEIDDSKTKIFQQKNENLFIDRLLQISASIGMGRRSALELTSDVVSGNSRRPTFL